VRDRTTHPYTGISDLALSLSDIHDAIAENVRFTEADQRKRQDTKR